MNDRLRRLWDFDDLDGSERRLRTQLDEETSDDGRAEVMTQLARVARASRGLRERRRAARRGGRARRRARAVRDRASTSSEAALRRSSGDPEAARPLFESAYAACARRAAALPRSRRRAHGRARRAATARRSSSGRTAASSSPRPHEAASYWLGPLLNNLGWEYYEAGDFELALDAFERALRGTRARPRATATALALARYAVGKTLRALGRSDEAIPLLELAVEWSESAGAPDGWFHEELAEEYAAVGRADDARTQARLAIPLLETDDPVVRERRGTHRAARATSPASSRRPRAGCSRACASAWARASRAPSRVPRSAPGACAAAG